MISTGFKCGTTEIYMKYAAKSRFLDVSWHLLSLVVLNFNGL